MLIKNNLLLLQLTFLFLYIQATTEWFGDLRAHLNPPQAPPYYDITYEDGGTNNKLNF